MHLTCVTLHSFTYHHSPQVIPAPFTMTLKSIIWHGSCSVTYHPVWRGCLSVTRCVRAGSVRVLWLSILSCQAVYTVPARRPHRLTHSQQVRDRTVTQLDNLTPVTRPATIYSRGTVLVTGNMFKHSDMDFKACWDIPLIATNISKIYLNIHGYIQIKVFIIVLDLIFFCFYYMSWST